MQVKDRIDFYSLDGVHFLLNVVNQYSLYSTLLSIDPPYVKKGPRLYENSFGKTDHAELSNIISMLRHKWIVTYDKCPLISNLYSQFRKETITLEL